LTPQVRQLPPEEWHRLNDFEPFATHGLPTVEHWRVVVAEDGDQIVGFCCLFNAVHWEPWWVHESYQKRPGLLRQMIRHGKGLLHDAGVDCVFVVVGDELPAQQALVERFGFSPVPGKFYFLTLDGAR
jgi:hypothetical protein